PTGTVLGSFYLRGSATSTSIGLSGLTVTHYEMATTGAPVDWTGSCQSSDKGFLVPAGKVECGIAPAPAHDPALPDSCSAGVIARTKNMVFFARNRGLLTSLGSTAGIIQTVTYPDGSPLYKPGDVIEDARFIGQVFGP